MQNYPRIIFYGTPEFAVASLEALISSGYNVAAVVTAPDRPSGRGMKMNSSPVKKYALDRGLHLMQPANLKDPLFHRELMDLHPDLQVVVAFRMLPAEIWSLPPLGTFNLHASLLPRYRGAAPIHRAIINGEAETGVTTFFLNEKIDEGTVIFQKKISIGPEETAGELHDRLMVLGSALVVETVDAIAVHAVKGIPQELLITLEAQVSSAPKIRHEECRINWDDTVTNVFNFIRGLSPHPGAFTFLTSSGGDPLYLKIYKSLPGSGAHSFPPGQVLTDGKTFLKIAVRDGFIHLTEVQPSGRKTLPIADFIRGAQHHFS